MSPGDTVLWKSADLDAENLPVKVIENLFSESTKKMIEFLLMLRCLFSFLRHIINSAKLHNYLGCGL